MTTAIEDRINELMRQRGIDPTTQKIKHPRPRPALSETTATETRSRDPIGAKSLPGSWRGLEDNYRDGGQRERLHLENKIAAWAIAHCLGNDWNYESSKNGFHYNHAVRHRDGYGFSVSREWNDSKRLRFVPLCRHRLEGYNLPDRITVSETRKFADIARDLDRRLISQGLKENHAEDLRVSKENQDERRSESETMQRIAEKIGGNMRSLRNWHDSRPTVRFPGGQCWIDYMGKIEFEFCCNADQAETIAVAIKSSNPT